MTIGTVLTILVLFSGAVALRGRGERNYQSRIQLGRNAAIGQDYRTAENDFQLATRTRPDSRGTVNLVGQTQSFLNGRSALKHHQLALAVRQYHRALRIGSLPAINHRSAVQLQIIRHLQNSSKRFAAVYNRAIRFNHAHHYYWSGQLIKRTIKNDPRLHWRYFRGTLGRFRRLERLDRESDYSNQDRVTSGSVVDKKSPRFTQNLLKKRSYQRVTRHELLKARTSIRRAGIKVQEMSNRDVENLIHQAHQHGMSIYEYAKKNY